MKKNILLISMMVMILLAGCSNQTAQKSNPESSQTAVVSNNDSVDISKFSIKKIEDKDSLPVAVSSIKEVLTSTGRFHEGEVTGDSDSLQVQDVFFDLGVVQKDGNVTASFTIHQDIKSPKDSTKLVSYSFTKSDMQMDKSKDIRWGLKTFLQLFNVELTDDMWNDIVVVSNMAGDTAGMGTDYWGYGDEGKGIQLIYANLADTVQIDINPYSKYMGKMDSNIKELPQTFMKKK